MWTGQGFRYAAYPVGPGGAAAPVEPELHRVLQGWDTDLDEVVVTADRLGSEPEAPGAADSAAAGEEETDGETGDDFKKYVQEHWAPSRSYKVEAENAEGNKERREVDGLWIYVGRQWRAWEKAWWAEMTEEERRAHRKKTEAKRKDYYETASQNRLGMADVVKAGAHPAAHLAEVSGLEGVLGSGQFTVSGSVFFNPLRAFDPNVQMPPADERDFFSEEEITLYRFPE